MLALAAISATLSGCANPGPPKAPSLNLPSWARNLTVERTGDTVELRFTAPRLSTDKLPLKARTIRGSFCRQVGRGPCVTVPGSGGEFAVLDSAGRQSVVVWHDALPGELTSGAHTLLEYRVELFNSLNRSAGPSDPAYTVAGAAPGKVEQLHAAGSRRGVVLQWAPDGDAGDEVLLRREGRAPLPAKGATQAEAAPRHTSGLSLNNDSSARQEVVWMSATPAPGDRAQDRSLDTSAVAGVPYSYQALRRAMVKIGGRTLELRGALSEPTKITLETVYASAAPTGLVAAPFSNATSPGMAAPFAVDLVWQPVDDADIAGYNVYRQRLDEGGVPVGAKEKLTTTLARDPGFHDATAKPNERYRYSVTAVDSHDNESAAVTTVLEPSEVQ
jgi:hypothetical protein